jgi:hypothetical protein
MKMVFATLAVWLLLVLVGAGIIAMTSKADDVREFVAARHLRGNHRLIEGDIAEVGAFDRVGRGHYSRFLVADIHSRDDFRGRYVASTVDKETAINLPETSTGPKLHAVFGVITWVPLTSVPPSEVALLDVQDVLSICPVDNVSRCGKFTILAMTCTDQGTQNCSAAIEVTELQRKRLWKTGKLPLVRVLTVGGSP